MVIITLMIHQHPRVVVVLGHIWTCSSESTNYQVQEAQFLDHLASCLQVQFHDSHPLPAASFFFFWW